MLLHYLQLTAMSFLRSLVSIVSIPNMVLMVLFCYFQSMIRHCQIRFKKSYKCSHNRTIFHSNFIKSYLTKPFHFHQEIPCRIFSYHQFLHLECNTYISVFIFVFNFTNPFFFSSFFISSETFIPSPNSPISIFLRYK